MHEENILRGVDLLGLNWVENIKGLDTNFGGNWGVYKDEGSGQAISADKGLVSLDPQWQRQDEVVWVSTPANPVARLDHEYIGLTLHKGRAFVAFDIEESSDGIFSAIIPRGIKC